MCVSLFCFSLPDPHNDGYIIRVRRHSKEPHRGVAQRDGAWRGGFHVWDAGRTDYSSGTRSAQRLRACIVRAERACSRKPYLLYLSVCLSISAWPMSESATRIHSCPPRSAYTHSSYQRGAKGELFFCIVACAKTED